MPKKKSWEAIDSDSPKSAELKKAETNVMIGFIVWCFVVWCSTISAILNKNFPQLIWLLYYWVLLYFLYKKNRMAALFLAIWYTLDILFAVIIWWLAVWLFGLLFIAWIVVSIIGTFSYHKITNNTKLSTSEIVILVIGVCITLITLMWIASLFYA